jgi:hypothetical protein
MNRYTQTPDGRWTVTRDERTPERREIDRTAATASFLDRAHAAYHAEAGPDAPCRRCRTA